MTPRPVSPVSRFRSKAARFGARLFFAAILSHSAHGALRLPAVISDHAMIQAGKPAAVWGWATPGDEVSVIFVSTDVMEFITAKTAADGRWGARLSAVPDGTVGEIEVRTKTEGPIKVADVLASGNNDMPSRLYNAMIHGLEPYTLKGFLWFQGDGNFGNPQKYGELIKTLIRAWRAHFHDDTLPLYYVEMQNYHAPQEKPVEPNPMSLIREAQQSAPKPGEQLANLYNRPYPHGRVTGISI